MKNLQQCADAAIARFVQALGPPYWPNWATLVPGDTASGWGASKSEWRAQAHSIVDDFQKCVGIIIDARQGEIDRLRSEQLAAFSDYLVQKATLHAARLAVTLFQAHLSKVKASVTRFVP